VLIPLSASRCGPAAAPQDILITPRGGFTVLHDEAMARPDTRLQIMG